MHVKAKLIAEIIFAMALISLIMMLAPNIPPFGESVHAEIARSFLISALMIGVVLVACRLRKETALSALGFSKPSVWKQVLAAIPMFVLLIAILLGAPLLLGYEKEKILGVKSQGAGFLFLYIFYQMICVGMGEEIIFRGYLYESLKKLGAADMLPVIVSSVLFGLFHFPSTGSPIKVLITSIMGFIYGYGKLKIKYCSTLTVGIAHGLHNSFIIILSYFLL